MRSKAAFLLFIFLLHTAVGFGCALVMQEGIADQSHASITAVHEHKDNGHKVHEYKVHEYKSHQHSHAEGHQHQTNPKQGLDFSKEDPCCKKLVNELTIQSKLIPESVKVLVVLPVALLNVHSHPLLVPVTSMELAQSGYIDHRYRSPDKDIRITIQSFQI